MKHENFCLDSTIKYLVSQHEGRLKYLTADLQNDL